MRFTTSVMALCLSAGILCSCAGVTTLTAERPTDEAFRTSLKRERSTLNIPIETSTEELSRVLNKSIRTDLYKGSTTTKGVTATVTRSGNIAITASDDNLYVTLPITLSLGYSFFQAPPLPLQLKFRIKADIASDWRLHTEIYYLGLGDLLAEEIGLGPLSFKPRAIVEGLTQPVQKMVSDLISQKINELFPIKAEVQTAWNRAHKTILLDKQYNAWLRLAPQEVMLFPLTAANNRLKASIGISTYAELVVGPEPTPSPLTPLPALRKVTTFDKNFQIAINADLYYADMKAIAAPLILNKRFDSEGKHVTITDFDLYGNGSKLVVKLQTTGSVEGIFYLTATPVFNPRTNGITMENVDFDMQTQNLLHRSANWFLHGTIRELIQEKLNMNIGQQLEQSRLMAGKALERIQLADHLIMKGEIRDLTFNDMIVQKEKISVQVHTNGSASVLFQ